MTITGFYESEQAKKLRDRMAHVLLSTGTAFELASDNNERAAAIEKTIELLEMGKRYCASTELRTSILQSLQYNFEILGLFKNFGRG